MVVAKNGPDDRPDPSTLRSFIMESSCGLSYAAGTWRKYTDLRLDICASS